MKNEGIMKLWVDAGFFQEKVETPSGAGFRAQETGIRIWFLSLIPIPL